jgi:hypothetical protein
MHFEKERKKKEREKTIPAMESAKVKFLNCVKCCTRLDRISSVGVRKDRNISLFCYISTNISSISTCGFSSYVHVSGTRGLYLRHFGIVYCLHF